jgi:hypothetical protein
MGMIPDPRQIGGGGGDGPRAPIPGKSGVGPPSPIPGTSPGGSMGTSPGGWGSGVPCLVQTRKSGRPAESGPRFPFPAESGNGDSLFPGQIYPSRESGIPSPIPGKKSGIGGSDSRFPSDVRASTAVDSEYTQPRVLIMPVLSQAACGS